MCQRVWTSIPYASLRFRPAAAVPAAQSTYSQCQGSGLDPVARAQSGFVHPKARALSESQACCSVENDSTPPQRSTAIPQPWLRSEEHTSELQSLLRTSYAVFCLKKQKNKKQNKINIQRK